MSLSVVILAAGKGTRMKSAIPKVLHQLAGKPMLGHVIDTARALAADRIAVVYGYGGETLPEAFGGQSDLQWVRQEPQLGTGHAVQQAASIISGSDKVLVLYGDVPLTPAPLLAELVQTASTDNIALLTAQLPDPYGYGRIIRNSDGEIISIVEQQDASGEQLEIHEINTGIMALPTPRLLEYLQRINNHNAQGEYYLTDVITLAVDEGLKIVAKQVQSVEHISGVNSRQQLVELERFLYRQQAARLAEQGVTIRDPGRFELRGNLQAAQDIEIDINVVLEGEVKIGSNVTIEPNCLIRNSTIANDVTILANSIIEDSEVGDGCTVGPFARLRPATTLQPNAKIGNFVEVKKSTIGAGSKVNHLSYIGDTLMGAGVNIGAGTITCNYDGANKHQTIIEDDVFIGSDTQIVAPAKVGKGATIAAGTTITKQVPEGSLALSRTKQQHFDNWLRPVKKKNTK